MLNFLNLNKNFLGGGKHGMMWLCKTFGFSLNQKIFIIDLYIKASMVKFLNDFDFEKFEKNKKANILKLVECSFYKGRRHVKYLPVNGQRTHSNAKTRKKRHVS